MALKYTFACFVSSLALYFLFSIIKIRKTAEVSVCGRSSAVGALIWNVGQYFAYLRQLTGPFPYDTEKKMGMVCEGATNRFAIAFLSDKLMKFDIKFSHLSRSSGQPYLLNSGNCPPLSGRK